MENWERVTRDRAHEWRRCVIQAGTGRFTEFPYHWQRASRPEDLTTSLQHYVRSPTGNEILAHIWQEVATSTLRQRIETNLGHEIVTGAAPDGATAEMLAAEAERIHRDLLTAVACACALRAGPRVEHQEIRDWLAATLTANGTVSASPPASPPFELAASSDAPLADQSAHRLRQILDEICRASTVRDAFGGKATRVGPARAWVEYLSPAAGSSSSHSKGWRVEAPLMLHVEGSGSQATLRVERVPGSGHIYPDPRWLGLPRDPEWQAAVEGAEVLARRYAEMPPDVDLRWSVRMPDGEEYRLLRGGSLGLLLAVLLCSAMRGEAYDSTSTISVALDAQGNPYPVQALDVKVPHAGRSAGSVRRLLVHADDHVLASHLVTDGMRLEVARLPSGDATAALEYALRWGNQLAVGLQRYLRAVRDWPDYKKRNVPTYLNGRLPSQIYISPRVIAAGRTPGGRESRRAAPRAELWQAVCARDRRVVVEGEAGQGKSLLARMTASRFADEGLRMLERGESLDKIPIPVQLELATIIGSWHASAAAKVISAEVDRHVETLLLDAKIDASTLAAVCGYVNQALHSARAVLFLDEFEEIAQDRRSADLLDFLHSHACRIILTRRTDAPYELPEEPAWARYSLQPLTVDERNTFLRLWRQTVTSTERRQRLAGRRHRQLELADVSYNLLHLTLYCAAVERGVISDADTLPAVCIEIIRGMFSDEWRDALALQLIQKAAGLLFERDPEANTFTRDELLGVLGEAAVGTNADIVWTATRLVSIGLLVPRENKHVGFVHHLFLEALAREGQAARDHQRREQRARWITVASLDLGSETMAAYYRWRIERTTEAMVRLQSRAAELVGAQPRLYREAGDPAEGSPRFLNQVLLTSGVAQFTGDRSPFRLPEDHALLDLFTEQGAGSIFRFFVGAQEDPSAFFSRLLHPKLLMHGGSKYLPAIFERGKSDSDAVQVDPQDLLLHLLTQVVRNLVFRSPELEEADPKSTRLTIAIPNIYSLTHKWIIEDFADRMGVGQVDVIYESDAVAYYALGTAGRDPDTQQFFERMRSGSPPRFHLMTIDVGRGTTDMTLMEVRWPKGAAEPTGIQVLSRTGTMDGGNHVNYLLASHYERQIQRVFRELAPHGVKRPPFSLCWLEPGHHRPSAHQRLAVDRTAQLAEAVKCAFTERLRPHLYIDLSVKKQRELAEPVVQSILEALNTYEWSPAEYEALKEALRDALLLPVSPSVAASEGPVPSVSQMCPGARELRELQEALERYVCDNGRVLIEELIAGAYYQGERLPERWRQFVQHWLNRPYVVVAGRATQFKPLRAEIRRALKDTVRARHIHYLSGRIAKEACCRGAVFHADFDSIERNPDFVHGACVLVDESPFEDRPLFTPIDMRELNERKEVTLLSEGARIKRLFYSTRINLTGRDAHPTVGDRWSARLASLGSHGPYLRIRIVTEPGTRPRMVAESSPDGVTFTQDDELPIPSYGSIQVPWAPRLWPDLLINRDEDWDRGDTL